MDVKQLLNRLSFFDTDMVVTCGGSDQGWSNIEMLTRDGSCVKIVMSDNVIFSDDRAAEEQGAPALQTGNSDYAAAQQAFDEWKEEFDTCEGDKCGFEPWLQLRLNAAKAPHCA